jgi:hypothetical protein
LSLRNFLFLVAKRPLLFYQTPTSHISTINSLASILEQKYLEWKDYMKEH